MLICTYVVSCLDGYVGTYLDNANGVDSHDDDAGGDRGIDVGRDGGDAGYADDGNDDNDDSDGGCGDDDSDETGDEDSDDDYIKGW